MRLTSIMYHYVRPLKGSRHPKIKGLELSGFREQLDYLSQQYEFISADHLIAHLKLGDALPDNACLLTFDDGYRDHFDFVLPELTGRGIKGCFFPPACSVIEKKLLDVNAIHFILAATGNISILIADLKAQTRMHGMPASRWDELWVKLAKPNNFDGKEVIFFKRMLQRELSAEMRAEIVTNLFEKHVGRSEREFCEELYMTADDLRELQSAGMYIGSHTYNHIWLDSLDRERQESEIRKSLEFLSSLGAPVRDWIMCYPYGGYNHDTIDILKAHDCIAGFTTKTGICHLDQTSPFEVNRFDTNDFPQGPM